MDDDDSASSTDLSYSSWISLPIEVKNQKFANIKKLFDSMSDCEAEIMRRILCYMNELNEINNQVVLGTLIGDEYNTKYITIGEMNYQWIWRRLRGDQYNSSYICSIAWDGIDGRGLEYSARYNFIKLLKTERIQPVIEETLIIDLNFQAQFTNSQATDRYKTMWRFLPNIFVGTEEKLRRIISIICSAIDEPFPPLMKPDFLYNKWLSPNRRLIHY